MKKTLYSIRAHIFLLAILFCTILQAQESDTLSIPQWLIDDWTIRTADEGVWITDNAEYKNNQEPYDGYGQEVEYGLGQKHLKIRLFCIKEGKDIGTVWQITEYWDPEAGEVRILQIGSDGTVGHGKVWKLEDGSSKEQGRFSSPDGSSFDSGHHVWMENGELHTRSFNIVNGEWQSRRYYIWKPAATIVEKAEKG